MIDYDFKCDNCSRIKIELFKKANQDRPARTVEISDTATITKIQNILDKLPTDGEIMISMIAVDVIRVTMFSNTGDVYFEYHNNRLKTPGTSYYAREVPEEKELLKLLKGLVAARTL